MTIAGTNKEIRSLYALLELKVKSQTRSLRSVCLFTRARRWKVLEKFSAP